MNYQRFENEAGLSLEETNPAPSNGNIANGNAPTHHEVELDFSTQIADEITEPELDPEPEKEVSSTTSTYDQIEVEIMGGKSEQSTDDVLINAKDFFLEYNVNYELSWEEASLRVSDGADGGLDEDPSKPPVPGWNVEYVRWKTRRIIESLWFRIFTALLILLDVSIVIAEVANGKFEHNMVFLILDLVITVYFVIEIGLRIWVLTSPVFFTEWFNVVDFAVVLITLITSVAVIAAAAGVEWAEKLGVIVALRFVRFVRVCRVVSEREQVKISVRQLVSQNKRRYQQDGYDLDLTYVTKRVIATSFPSTGMWAMYRNPIEHVAKFLNDKHKGHYRMYNLCSEKTYDVSLFGGDSAVRRFEIDDHNVPSLAEMIRFSQEVKEWMAEDPENIIVVHCKGGKGRTGTMICVWLVESGVFSSAKTSLDYFGSRRTDKNVSKKFQGVETPSQ